MLHLFISGALYRPLPVHVIITRNARKKLERVNYARELKLLKVFTKWLFFGS